MAGEVKITNSFRIRLMTKDDIEDVAHLEHVSSTEPWSKDLFRKELKSPLSVSLVADDGGLICGYLVFWIVADEVHIQNIAVNENLRRRGIADKLLTEMHFIAKTKNAFTATLEVRRSNESAIKLYEKFGFVVKGCRERYYSDTKEDALIMWADLK